jgi:uncharacterized RDD family membrane protein YckC
VTAQPPAADALRATVLAPEGIALHFRAATAAERVLAFLFDLLVLAVLLLALGIATAFAFGLGGLLLLAFVVRHGYFVFLEARTNGRTFGKRILRLRVIRADGGPLTTEVLLARNLTREVELFLPMLVLLAPDMLFPGHPGPLRLLAALWVLLLLFFPLLNRQRLRIGDLLAGTRVVLSPQAPLLADLAARPGAAAPATAGFRLAPAQLEIYGEHELQVLEDVLRKRDSDDAAAAFATVAKSICRRIGYDLATVGDHEGFLRAFYAAQREHLEQRLALGRRRRHKQPRR